MKPLFTDKRSIGNALEQSWQVIDVELSLEEQRVRIRLAATGKQPACCSECSAQRPLKDHAPERTSIAGMSGHALEVAAFSFH